MSSKCVLLHSPRLPHNERKKENREEMACTHWTRILAKRLLSSERTE